MSLQDLATDYQPAERPARQSLDPAQPTREELAALAAQQARARAPQPVQPPLQQGPGIAFPRLGQTNPAQVAALNPSIPQAGVGLTPQQPDETGLKPPGGKQDTGLPMEVSNEDLKKIDADQRADPKIAALREPVQPANDGRGTPLVDAPAVYQPPPANRSAAELGSPWWPTEGASKYPGVVSDRNMPTPQEAYRVGANAAAKMAVWGSEPVADAYRQTNLLMNPLAAVADAFSQGRFSQNFSAANLRGLQIQQYNAYAQQQQAMQLHADELMSVGRFFLFDEHGQHEAAAAGLRDWLYTHQHQNLIPILDSQGVKGVFRMFQEEDALYRQTHASNTQLGKVLNTQTGDENLRGLGYEPGGVLFGSSGGRLEITRPAAPGEMSPEQTTIAGTHNLSPQAFAMADRRLNEEDDPTYADLGKSNDPREQQAFNAVNGGVRDMQDRIERAIRGPGDFETKAKEIEKFSPRYAEKLRGFHDWQLKPGDEAIKNRNTLMSQVHRMDHNWNRNNFENIQKYTQATNPEFQMMAGIGNMEQTYLGVMSDLNAIGDKSIPRRVIEAAIARNITGVPPQYIGLYNKLVAYEVEASRVLSLTGPARVSILNKLLEGASSTMSPGQVISLMQSEMLSAWRTTGTFIDNWQSLTGKNTLPPPLRPHDYNILRAIVRQDPSTRKFPEDAPDEVKAVNPKTVDPKFKDQRPPLTMQQIFDLKDLIEQNAKNPNPEIQAELQRAREKIGPLIGLGRKVPGIDIPANP